MNSITIIKVRCKRKFLNIYYVLSSFILIPHRLWFNVDCLLSVCKTTSLITCLMVPRALTESSDGYFCDVIDSVKAISSKAYQIHPPKRLSNRPISLSRDHEWHFSIVRLPFSVLDIFSFFGVFTKGVV